MKRHILVGLAATVLGNPVRADETQTPYAGLEAREIATLSDSDIADLKAGRGWGFALVAELNGHPGPAHVLELAEDLNLSPDQITRVTQIFEAMQADAIAAGAVFISAEQALEGAFSRGGLSAAELQRLVREAGQARSNLRIVHLTRHLETLSVLSAGQVAQYNDLRGYTNDPCANIPEGHNVDMWRRHNGCDK